MGNYGREERGGIKRVQEVNYRPYIENYRKAGQGVAALPISSLLEKTKKKYLFKAFIKSSKIDHSGYSMR